MRWASAVSGHKSIRKAVAQTSQEIQSQLEGRRPDLILIFVSDYFAADYEKIPNLVAEFANGAMIVGCSAGGVIGGGREVEQGPGFSMTAALLPGVDIIPLRMQTNLIPDEEASLQEWEAVLHLKTDMNPEFVLLPEPYSFDVEYFLKGLDKSFPQSQKVGGMVSGDYDRGGHAMFLGKKVYREGMIGIAMSGNVTVDTLVAQGCRPVGHPMFVTRCEENILYELDGQEPVAAMRDLYNEMDEADQELFSTSLFIGVVMKDSLQEYKQGDFLIRNIIGIETETGALITGADVHENSVVQFHLRDAATSDADLTALLTQYVKGSGKGTARGSLLFSCLGRGMDLYGCPNHDTDLLKKYLGELPVGGFFCNGEIGPVQGSTFLHGYTSSFGFFRSRRS